MAITFVPAAMVAAAASAAISSGVGPAGASSASGSMASGMPLSVTAGMSLSSLLLPHAASPNASTAAQQTVIRFFCVNIILRLLSSINIKLTFGDIRAPTCAEV